MTVIMVDSLAVYVFTNLLLKTGNGNPYLG